ncbi:MAG TPA: Glu/Leu/Phe/Val dehydrogenase dimerization domain-containing protein [Solirubrobacteraceae bacterium]|nr:Glu/Leu/Phe/Val dehydrogenase dimerization domain-containing protein [Solirubrobacteraceae bacterium]
MRRGRRSRCFTIVAVHSTARGPALGGCRMWHYRDSRAAVRDALRLSQAMTFKSAVAGLPLGGGKGVIMAPDPAGAGAPRSRGRSRRADALRDFGETVEALGGSYITAEDVGTSARDMQLIASVTSHVTGLSRRHGGSGDPSPWTALGVESAIRVSCERVFGTDSLADRTIAISGLGNVGGRVATACAKAGATLLVTDIDPRKRALADGLRARWVEPGEALGAAVDVFAPCALGGLLDHDSVARLGAPIVAGAANNQLADDDVAELLAARGVLWAPDFVVNAGGIINISVELDPGGYDARRAGTLVRGIGDTLRRIYDDAAAREVTPLAAAMALARRRLAEAGG